MKKLFWVTDLDDTVVPQLDIPGRVEGADLRDLKTYLSAELIANGGVVVSSTGRHRAMSEADNLLHGDNRFPAQYAIYNVGTEIYEYQNGNWALLQSYVDAGFNDVTIYSIFNQAARDLSGFEIVPQEPDRNSKFKVSFYANQSLNQAVMTEVLAPYLAEQDTQLILRTHNNTRTFIDVLPSRAGKGMAMRFLARHLLVRTSLGTSWQTFRIGTARQTFLGVDSVDLPRWAGSANLPYWVTRQTFLGTSRQTFLIGTVWTSLGPSRQTFRIGRVRQTFLDIDSANLP